MMDNVKHTEFYYVKMAVAWTLSIAYIKYPDKIMQYLQSGNNHLDKDTYNISKEFLLKKGIIV